MTLNLNISASRQNIKNLIGNFGDIHVGIMHAKFQASSKVWEENEVASFTSVGGEWGGEHTQDITPDSYTKFLNSPLCFASGGIIPNSVR